MIYYIIFYIANNIIRCAVFGEKRLGAQAAAQRKPEAEAGPRQRPPVVISVL